MPWVSHTQTHLVLVFWITALLIVFDRLSVIYSLQKERAAFYQPTCCSLCGELLQPQLLFKTTLKHQLRFLILKEAGWTVGKPDQMTTPHVRKGITLKAQRPGSCIVCMCVFCRVRPMSSQRQAHISSWTVRAALWSLPCVCPLDLVGFM